MRTEIKDDLSIAGSGATNNFSRPGGSRLAVAASFIWLLMAAGFLPRSSQVTPDSAAYIECAKNLASKNGCMVTPWKGFASNRWEPMAVFPPGYPILVAPLIAAGLDPLKAAIAVSVLSGALFFFVLGLLSWRLSAPAISIAIVTFTLMTPALWEFGTSANSDVPFLLFSALSIWAMLNQTDSASYRARWLFFAGLLTGAAYVIRSASLALIAAEGLFLLAVDRGIRVSRILPWAGGVTVSALPLLVRNWIVFRSFVPYSMPVSTKSFVDNLREMFAVIVADMVGTKHAGNLVQNVNILLISTAIAAVVAILCAFRFGPNSTKLLVLYATTYCALILAWRTKYHAEPIGSRYMFQIYWIIWIVFAQAVASWAGRRRLLAAGALAMGVLLVGLHARLYFAAPVPRPLNSADLGRSVEFLRRQVRPGQAILSTEAYWLRLAGDLNARQAGEGNESVTFADLNSACQAGTLWGVYFTNAEPVRAGKFGPALQGFLNGESRFGTVSTIPISGQAVAIRCPSRTQ